MMDVSEKALWETRAFAYRLLSVVLALPDQYVVNALVDGSLVSDIDEAARKVGLASSSNEGVAYEKALNDLVASASPAMLSDLRREYTRLFSGPSAVLPVWETLFVHRRQGQENEELLLIRSREAVDARRCYEGAGLEVIDGESPDHLRIECAFAAYLCEEVVRASDDEGRLEWADRYERFASTHLDRWMREFFECVSCEARIPYYHMVGLIGARMGADAARA